jgi:hypothetical protein
MRSVPKLHVEMKFKNNYSFSSRLYKTDINNKNFFEFVCSLKFAIFFFCPPPPPPPLLLGSFHNRNMSFALSLSR